MSYLIDLQVSIDYLHVCQSTGSVSLLKPCHCSNITVRREIDSLNERLTGDGQTIEGGDPTKGALKTKGQCMILSCSKPLVTPRALWMWSFPSCYPAHKVLDKKFCVYTIAVFIKSKCECIGAYFMLMPALMCFYLLFTFFNYSGIRNLVYIITPR